MKCPQPLHNDLHRNAAFEAVFYWEKGMLKRLYKRFLEWALAPVLADVRHDIVSIREAGGEASLCLNSLQAASDGLAAEVQSLRVARHD